MGINCDLFVLLLECFCIVSTGFATVNIMNISKLVFPYTCQDFLLVISVVNCWLLEFVNVQS